MAKDRADDHVAWEDEAGMWDDWLDVQVAAIKALGHMQASEAIDDLLDARTDEMGQELDIVVFAALADIEDGGLSALFALLRDRDPKVRERVIRALSKARPEAMLPMQAILLRDVDPRIRRLAIDTLKADDQAVTDLALRDTDASVRAAALSAFAPARPDLVMAALCDPDECVLAVALQSLPMDLDASVADDLAANLQAWMETAGSALAATAAEALPKVANPQADDALCRLAGNEARPIEARIASLQALSNLSSKTVIEALSERIEDPVRQIRTAALAALAAIAERQDDPFQGAAETVLVAAILGELGTGVTVAPDGSSACVDDIGASKVEAGHARITISPDGEIVTLDENSDDQGTDNVIEGRFPTSTLSAIQSESITGPITGEDESRVSGRQWVPRRRVAVDGPDDVKQDIRIFALGMIDKCSSRQMEQVLLDALGAGDEAVRLAAFKTAARCSKEETPRRAMIDACKIALTDTDPHVRGYAATVIEQSAADAPNLLTAHVEDPDPIVRDAALKALEKIRPKEALGRLRDSSPIVRRTALQMLVASTDKDALVEGIDICFAEERLDTLKNGCKHCSTIRTGVLSSIGKDKLTKRQLRLALEALA